METGLVTVNKGSSIKMFYQYLIDYQVELMIRQYMTDCGTFDLCKYKVFLNGDRVDIGDTSYLKRSMYGIHKIHFETNEQWHLKPLHYEDQWWNNSSIAMTKNMKITVVLAINNKMLEKHMRDKYSYDLKGSRNYEDRNILVFPEFDGQLPIHKSLVPSIIDEEVSQSIKRGEDHLIIVTHTETVLHQLRYLFAKKVYEELIIEVYDADDELLETFLNSDNELDDFPNDFYNVNIGILRKTRHLQKTK